MTSVGSEAVEERHASWLELFFDLVVVAGIGQLAHLLSGEGHHTELWLYVVVYTAFWLVWACFTAYSNILGEAVHVATMLAGMAALCVMIAAVPQVQDEHATAFAIAYVAGRFVVAQPWRAKVVVVDLPLVQAGFGVVPWIASWWVDGHAKQVLWAVGLALDLVLLVRTTRARAVADRQRRLDRSRESSEAGPAQVEIAHADVPHLAERLGAFVLIVLGESLIQAVDGAADATWDRHLATTGLGAFLLLVGLWFVAVRRGLAGVALLEGAAVTPRFAWLAHLVTTGALATLAAVVARLVAEPDRTVGAYDRSLALVAFGVYGLASAAVHAVLGLRADRGTFGRATALARAAWIGVPTLAVLALGALREDGSAGRLVWLLAGGVTLVALGWDGAQRVSRRRLAVG